MRARQYGSGWILTTDSNWSDSRPAAGSRSRSMSSMRESYTSWAGDRWVVDVAGAKRFATEKAAEEYMKQNLLVMKAP
jgi:hypothetical protein